MPTWGEILGELNASAADNNGQPDFDGVRRRYIGALHQLTTRPLITYYTDWMNGSAGWDAAINLSDMQGLMEVCQGLPGPSLDLILHSPGGSPEAAASIVGYLRRKFTDIRVFVPLAAMSAATMWSLACDEIVMGKHSQLGPIDPQMVTAQGQFPASAILRQFEQAKAECAADPSRVTAWFPILQQYGPSLLQQCEIAETLARKLVSEWLRKYMFAGKPNAGQRAARVARFFSNYGARGSHSLGIDRELARSKGLNVTDLEDKQDLQDAVLSIHHASMLTLNGSAVKLIENNLGRTFAKLQASAAIQIPIFQTPPAT